MQFDGVQRQEADAANFRTGWNPVAPEVIIIGHR